MRLLKRCAIVFASGVVTRAFCFGLFAFSALRVAAQEPGTASSTTVTIAAASQYFFRGLRYGGPSLQPMIEYDRGGLSAGIWMNTPIANKVPGQSDPEIDPFAAYRIVLNETVSLQPGATLYLYPRAEPGRGHYRATFEPNFAVNYTMRGVTFTPKLYYDVVLRGPTYELNAAYAIPVKRIGSELDFYASIGRYDWDAGIARATPRTHASGNYWNASVTLPFQITVHSKITASIGYAEGWNSTFQPTGLPSRTNTSAAGRVVATVGYSVTF